MSSFEESEDEQEQEKIQLSLIVKEKKVLFEDDDFALNHEEELDNSMDDLELDIEIEAKQTNPFDSNKDIEEDKKSKPEIETALLNNSGNFKKSFSKLSSSNLIK